MSAHPRPFLLTENRLAINDNVEPNCFFNIRRLRAQRGAVFLMVGSIPGVVIWLPDSGYILLLEKLGGVSGGAGPW